MLTLQTFDPRAPRSIPNGIVAGVGCYLAGQIGLAPFRIYQGVDPWIKFKKMMKARAAAPPAGPRMRSVHA
jgi:hypothetical protein